MNKQRKEFPIVYMNPPQRMAIGWGVYETIAHECKSYGIKKALVITTGLKKTGIIDEVGQVLKYNGVAFDIFDKVSSNPRDFQVMEAFQAYKDAQCNGVVTIGGGSSHDVGKAVRLLIANPEKHINDMAAWIDPPWYPEMLKLKHVTTPQISLNTTCGTGAESTNVAVVNNTKGRFKIITHPVPGLGPRLALIDPLFVRLQPSHLIAQTGFDAFTHSMEGYINRVHSPYTSALGIQVMKLVAENLREFASNRMNDVACENMCWAESMGGTGMCFGAGVGIVHGCGHVMAALTDAHHGFINSILSSPLERWNQPACPDKFADIARLSFGVDTKGMTKMEASDKFFDELDRLLKDLGIKSGHLKEQIGLQEKDLKHVAKYYQMDWGREGNPRDSTIDQTVALLRSIL
jgi:formaldehyde dismutase / methanol dehydrogenase